jgi:hypothetical protein
MHDPLTSDESGNRKVGGTMKRNQLATHVLAPLLVGMAVLLASQLKAQESVPVARVFMYLIGRGYLNPVTGHGEVVGYITHIDGIPGPLFSGPPSESAAFFTFRSDVFSIQPLPPNGDVVLSEVSAGTVSIYLNRNPNGDWNNPDTFSTGQLIATFRRGESVFVQIGPESHHVLSERLVFSQDFTFRDKELNFGRLATAATFSEFISNTPLPAVEGFPVGLPFAANAVAVGQQNLSQ